MSKVINLYSFFNTKSFFVMINKKRLSIFMGRKRMDPEQKTVTYTISIKKQLLDDLKKSGSPSQIITKLVTEYLEKMKKT